MARKEKSRVNVINEVESEQFIQGRSHVLHLCSALQVHKGVAKPGPRDQPQEPHTQ